MTEAEWLGCREPSAMQWFNRRNVTHRKLSLFSCACVRRLWHLLTDERIRRFVEFTESLLDSQVHRRFDSRLKRDAQNAADEINRQASQCASAREKREFRAKTMAASAVSWMLLNRGHFEVAHAASVAVKLSARADGKAGRPLAKKERKIQCQMLSCISGNPFRPVSFEPEWNTATVVALAAAFYEKRAFDELPILADALEDAGCRDEEILEH